MNAFRLVDPPLRDIFPDRLVVALKIYGSLEIVALW